MRIENYSTNKYEVTLSKLDQQHLQIGHTIGLPCAQKQFEVSYKKGVAQLVQQTEDTYNIFLNDLKPTTLRNGSPKGSLVKIVLEK